MHVSIHMHKGYADWETTPDIGRRTSSIVPRIVGSPPNTSLPSSGSDIAS